MTSEFLNPTGHGSSGQVPTKGTRPVSVRVRLSPRPPREDHRSVGFDEEARPAGSRQQAADRGGQGTVGRFQPGSWGLTAEDDELVAQDEDLQVLGGVSAGDPTLRTLQPPCE
jgi:hypothetical protein